MIGAGAAKTLLSGAVGVLGVGRDALSHAAWWVSYQVRGTTHDDGAAPDERSFDDGERG